MEMMITEYIKRMGDIRNNYDRWSKLGLTPNESKAFDFAVDTMCKYQKIQKIYERFQKEYGYQHHMAWIDVMEVLEDGKID